MFSRADHLRLRFALTGVLMAVPLALAGRVALAADAEIRVSAAGSSAYAVPSGAKPIAVTPGPGQPGRHPGPPGRPGGKPGEKKPEKGADGKKPDEGKGKKGEKKEESGPTSRSRVPRAPTRRRGRKSCVSSRTRMAKSSSSSMARNGQPSLHGWPTGRG